MDDNEQKRIFTKNLRRYMDLVDKPQSEVAKSIGVSPQTFNTWYKGIALPRMGKVQALADYFHCNKSDLIEDKSEQDAFAEGSGEQGGLHLVTVEDLPNVLPIYRHSIPVYRGIACGTPIEAAEHADYYAVSKEPIKANFAVIAKGDSMIDARIHDGDIVFIEKCSTVDNGEIAAVLIDGAATLKRVYYDADKEILSLVSENKAYAPMVYTKEDARDIRIMGRAICAQIFF
jgi:repressor LexA